jgi:NAD(P)-dependent dehydrogenase (short-subunit alcohol dehydrogenase family)
MQDSLGGKTAIVTGAASGMGRATVLALLDAGAAVVAGDVDKHGLCSLPPHPRLAVVPCDVTAIEDVERLVERAVTEFGALHVVCNAAGVCKEEPLVEASVIWNLTLDVNLNGVMNVCKAAIPALKQAGGGSIVNWGSTNSFEALPELAAYCASKAAVILLTKCIAVEHAKDGIRANSICPGWVDTPMVTRVAATYGSDAAWRTSVEKVQPLGLGTPESVADVAVFLASDASRQMTGSEVVVDGGWLAKSPTLTPPGIRLG